ncbi:MAG TPA: sensor domain-containing diguanylate cyclase [Longimicrobiaceae bacterium]|nr:sensor domain-containing diguanylate cyclase [Longimicrobiaceae bacterium]
MVKYRRREDLALSLLLASPTSTEEGAPTCHGRFRLEVLGCEAGPGAHPLAPPGRGAQITPNPEETVLLLDLGEEDAVLIVGAAIRRIPRGAGPEELLSRAAVGAAAWRDERLRTWRRYLLPEKLIAFSEQINAADTAEEVCQALTGHVLRMVDGYVALLFLREGEDDSFRPLESRLFGMDVRSLALPVHPRFTRPGLLTHMDTRADTGSPFAPLAPLFSEAHATILAHVPVGEKGILFLVERRDDRIFTPDDWEMLRTLADQAAAALRRVRLMEDVRRLSLTDPLTGLANRRRMRVVLEHAWAAARRGEPLTVLVIDLDDFKAINDQKGHLAGDRILCEVAECLRAEVRGSDLVVRYGGDEFVVILPRGTEEGARALVERVRKRLSERVRISAGIASYDPTFASPEELIELADARLYAAKPRNGRPAADLAVYTEG